MLLLLALISFSIILGYFLVIRPHKFWTKRGIVQPTLWEILEDSLKWMTGMESFMQATKNLKQRFPNARYLGVYQFTSPLLLINDPDIIKEFTVKSFDHFTDHRSISNSESDIFWTKSLFALNGEKWKRMRVTLSPTFTGSKMRIMFSLMDQAAKRYVDFYLDQPNETTKLEIKDSLTRLSNDIIATCAFGLETNSLKDPENEFYQYAKMGSNFSSFLNNIKMLIGLNFPKFSKFLDVEMMPSNVTKFFKEVVLGNMRERVEKNIYRPDVINLLMQTQKGLLKVEEDNAKDESFSVDQEHSQWSINAKTVDLSDDDIVAQAIVFVVGGFEAVANVLSFSLYELATNPDTQKKLQEEIDATLNKSGGTLSYDILMKMKYLDAVVSESLRKWPPQFQPDRVCTKDFTIKAKQSDENDVEIKEGDLVAFNTVGLHYDPDYFPNPERFDPERFNDENKRKINPYTYMPFGIGPRHCIANRFALMEVKTTLVHLLSKMDVVVIDQTVIPIKLKKSKFFIVPESCIWLGYKKRC